MSRDPWPVRWFLYGVLSMANARIVVLERRLKERDARIAELEAAR